MPTPPAKRSDIDSRPAEKQLADSAHVECDTNARETREKKQTVIFYNCLSLTPSLHDPEFNATTPPSAVHVEYIEKVNTLLDAKTEAKIRRN